MITRVSDSEQYDLIKIWVLPFSGPIIMPLNAFKVGKTVAVFIWSNLGRAEIAPIHLRIIALSRAPRPASKNAKIMDRCPLVRSTNILNN